MARSNKYNVSRVEDRTDIDGTVFASKAELRRWRELKLWERVEQIHDLKRQVHFPILYKGAVLTTYIADFVYTDTHLMRHVEDVKGVMTAEFKLKRKLMREVMGIEIEIVKVSSR